MKVIVATDGSLDPAKAAPLAASLAGTDGEILVLSIVEIPRQLLDAIRVAGGLDVPANAAGVEYSGQAGDPKPKPGWIGDDAVIARYVEDQRVERTEPMAEALKAAGVANVRTLCEDSENAVDKILSISREEGAEVLCIGVRGLGRFEGLLGSISTKLARRAPMPVLLVR